MNYSNNNYLLFSFEFVKEVKVAVLPALQIATDFMMLLPEYDGIISCPTGSNTTDYIYTCDILDCI